MRLTRVLLGPLLLAVGLSLTACDGPIEPADVASATVNGDTIKLVNDGEWVNLDELLGSGIQSASADPPSYVETRQEYYFGLRCKIGGLSLNLSVSWTAVTKTYQVWCQHEQGGGVVSP